MTALRAEWTKLRTVRSSWWALGLALGLTLLMTLFICSTVSTTGREPGDNGDDLLMLSVGGVLFAQFAVVALAVVAITGEHATGTIRATFAANPRRYAVLDHENIGRIFDFENVDGKLCIIFEYIDGWSLLLDCKIILLTFAAVLRGEGQ